MGGKQWFSVCQHLISCGNFEIPKGYLFSLYTINEKSTNSRMNDFTHVNSNSSQINYKFIKIENSYNYSHLSDQQWIQEHCKRLYLAWEFGSLVMLDGLGNTKWKIDFLQTFQYFPGSLGFEWSGDNEFAQVAYDYQDMLDSKWSLGHVADKIYPTVIPWFFRRGDGLQFALGLRWQSGRSLAGMAGFDLHEEHK